MRETMSARMHRSRINGVASRESSHLRCACMCVRADACGCMRLRASACACGYAIEKWSGHRRNNARVVHRDGVGPSHEDFRSVFVHGPLTVSNCRYVLDDHHVIRVLMLLVEDPIG